MKEKHNENTILEYYEKIQSFAQKEIDRTFKIYKLLIGGLIILFAFGIATFVFLFSDSRDEIEKKYHNSYQVALENEKENIIKEFQDTWTEEKENIEELIKKEFDKKYISNIVESHAQQRVDIIADKLIEKQIIVKISPLEEQLNKLEIETNKKLEKLIFDNNELVSSQA